MRTQTWLKNNISPNIPKAGFTLAEVLITLAVIGIIAALTIPTLIQTIKNNETASSVVKAMSELSQAYTSFISDGTDMDTVWGGGAADPTNVLNQFCTKLNCIQKCGTAMGCLPDVNYQNPDGSGQTNLNQNLARGKAILEDGTSIFLMDNAGGCTTDSTPAHVATSPLYYSCGAIGVDINGFKGPNEFGKDTFKFWVTRTGIVPMGSNNDNRACSVSSGDGCTSIFLSGGSVNL